MMTMWVLSFLPGKTRGSKNVIELNDVHDFFLQSNINDPNKISKALVTASLVWFGLLPMPWPGHLGFFIIDVVVVGGGGGVLWLGMVTMMMIDNDDAVGLWLSNEKRQSENYNDNDLTGSLRPHWRL